MFVNFFTAGLGLKNVILVFSLFVKKIRIFFIGSHETRFLKGRFRNSFRAVSFFQLDFNQNFKQPKSIFFT